MPRMSVAPALACLLAVAAAVPAAPLPTLDPGADTPYVWRVVVHAKPHPLLPAAARDQFVRDVRAALQPAVGPLARVEVADLAAVAPAAREPLWAQFAEKGWPALDAPAARKLTGVKTHFLKVEVRDGGYRLEAKQLDGDTGLLSPVLRVGQTDALEKLGRVAGMLLGRDFGPVATVDKFDAKAGTAAVRFRAGGLEGLDKFVRAGDVLAVAAVVDPPKPSGRSGPPPATPAAPPLRDGVPRPFTLLRLTAGPTDGVWPCQVLTRFANPFPATRGVVGFRALTLATVEGPVAVRVVRPGSGEAIPPSGLLRVRATDIDFAVRPDPRDALTLRDGVFRSARPMRNVACVVVGLGSVKEERFPVPVLGPGTAAAVPFEPNEADAARAAFTRDCEDLRARVAESRLAQVALFDGFGKLITKGDYPAALARATAGLDQIKAADKELSAELARLRGEPGAKDSLANALLASSDDLLQGLRLGEPAIKTRIGEIKDAMAKSSDPARFEREFRAKELLARARQHLEQGEGDEALALYDQLAALTGQADVKAARDKLADQWKSKSDEQTAARAFFAEWRKSTSTDELKSGLPQVQSNAEVLLKADDRYGLRGLLAALEPAYTKIKERADLLDPDTAADRPVVTELQALTNALREVETKAREHLKTLDPPPEAGM